MPDRRDSAIRRFLGPAAAALLVVLAVLSPLPLAAQSPAPLSADAAAELVEDAFSLIRDHALVAPDDTALLRAAARGVQQGLAGAGVSPPAPPVLTGTPADVPAVLEYVRAAALLMEPQPPDALVALVLRAMVRETADPLGAVYLPAEFARFVAVLRGERGGLGLQVDAWPDGIAVVELVDGGPAARAGLLVGDLIADIDGVPIRGRTPDAVMELLGGRVGTSVTVGTVRRGQPIRFVLAREQVRSIPIRARLIDARVGYIRLLEFSDQSAADLGRALSRLTAGGACPAPDEGERCKAAAILLDLRSNGGGLVDESVIIASHFLPAGLVAIEDRRAGPLMLLVRPVSPKFTGPMAVLVNGGSASASEIVAGALQDVGTPLVGAHTYGKGTVQSIFTLAAASAEWGLRLTTGRYRTRAGRAVEGLGLPPDVLVPMASSRIQGSDDIQFAAALQLVRSRLPAARP